MADPVPWQFQPGDRVGVFRPASGLYEFGTFLRYLPEYDRVTPRDGDCEVRPDPQEVFGNFLRCLAGRVFPEEEARAMDAESRLLGPEPDPGFVRTDGPRDYGAAVWDIRGFNDSAGARWKFRP